MLDLSYILSEDNIWYNISVKNKNELFEKMSEFISDRINNVHKEMILNGLMEREKLESTGVVNRVGLPHCYIDNIGTVKLFIAILKDSIDFDSLDKDRVKGVFFIISYKEAGEEYLRILSSIAYILKQDRIRSNILAAKTPKEIIDIMISTQDEQKKMAEQLKIILNLQKIESQILYNEMEKNITKENEKLFQQKIDELNKEKVEIEKKLTIQQLNHFNNLKRKYGNVVTAKVYVDGTCSGCNIKLPVHIIREVHRNQQIVTCSNCGKILYF